MKTKISKGKCNLCGTTFDKTAMTRHLKSCIQKQIAQKPSESKKPQTTKVFHLLVEGQYLPEYWMHIEIPAKATLAELDAFLRDIWLECCGHLSAFTINGRDYSRESSEWSDNADMDIPLIRVLDIGMKFYHEYDFGTSTNLAIKVVASRESAIKKNAINILARNDLPEIPCGECGKIATNICVECICTGEGWLCDKCAEKHTCGEELLLPVVNSPRVGMCGYTGED